MTAVEDVKQSHAKSVSSYDFKRPIQLSREHVRLLQSAYETFARAAGSVFTATLRVVCEVALDEVGQIAYDEYIASLDEATHMTLLDVSPLAGTGLFQVGLDPTMTCLDHMLGGSGAGPHPDRELTELENQIFGLLVGPVLRELQVSLAPIIDFALEPRSVEYAPRLIQAAGPSDPVIVARFILSLNGERHPFSLCLPFTGLHPYLVNAAAPARVSDRERIEREQAAMAVRRRIDEVPVDVRVRTRPRQMGPETLAALSVGQIIELGHPAAAPLEVVVGDEQVALATAGTHGRHLAALIVGQSKENA